MFTTTHCPAIPGHSKALQTQHPHSCSPFPASTLTKGTAVHPRTQARTWDSSSFLSLEIHSLSWVNFRLQLSSCSNIFRKCSSPLSSPQFSRANLGIAYHPSRPDSSSLSCHRLPPLPHPAHADFCTVPQTHSVVSHCSDLTYYLSFSEITSFAPPSLPNELLPLSEG